jgi:RimJ/RimL family protein N-acetyltransferase
VEKKDDDKSIGMCGVLNRDTLDHPDIGFAFLPDYNGKGYALEIARATMIYAKEKLGIPRITAITLPQNYKSIKLLEKMGLKYYKRFVFPNSNEELLLFMD